jgi:ectoine hydroxylase-related dioxygenase (phytanoyl-CoA dioxygenase family)
MWSEKLQRDYDELGYIVVDDAVEPNMLSELLEAAQRVKARVRAGEVDIYTDTRGEGDPFHINSLISLEYGEPIFGQYQGSKPLLDYVHSQIGQDIRIASVGIFTNPHHEAHNVAWHRDDGIDHTKSEEVELAYLRQPRGELRWELALVDDHCLEIVPGSHLRYRTEHEHDVMKNNKDESLGTTIHFKAGQTVFWDMNTIHRACHRPDVERLSVVSAFILHKEQDVAEKRDIGRFKHMLSPGVRESLPESLHLYYDRWRSLHE